MGKTLFTIKLKSRQEIMESIRKEWSFCPVQKPFKDKHKYDRKRDKRAYEKNIDGEY